MTRSRKKTPCCHIDDWKCVMGRRQFEMWLDDEPEDMREPLRRSYVGK